jgi:hypothetical protein
LRRHPHAPITVFAVWEPMLPTDISEPISGTLARLSDARARQYYDPDHLLAKRLKLDARPPQPAPDCCTSSGVFWDLIAIYPTGARWTDQMPVAPVFNGPVVDVIRSLENALTGK